MTAAATSKNHAQQGFTLIELSIVLVIIGLIVGGVLVGQDLIRAAEIRATVAQVEKYNTAINTFRTKYNGMPGDLVGAASFGFVARSGAAGLGDGNGLIESSNQGTATTKTYYLGETQLFWNDMAVAQLIPDATTSGTGAAPGANITANFQNYIPAAKLGRGNYIAMFSWGGLNYYMITGVTQIATTGIYTLSKGMSPTEAFNVDTKMDDGLPTTGVVQAFSDMAAGAPASHATGALVAGDCEDSTLVIYATNSTSTANTPGCMLRTRTN